VAVHDDLERPEYSEVNHGRPRRDCTTKTRPNMRKFDPRLPLIYRPLTGD